MSIFEFRQWAESAVPLWVLIACLITYLLYARAMNIKARHRGEAIRLPRKLTPAQVDSLRKAWEDCNKGLPSGEVKLLPEGPEITLFAVLCGLWKQWRG